MYQLWPFVDKMVQQILKEKVEPKLQEKLPGIISSLYFEKIHLGDQVRFTYYFTFHISNFLKVLIYSFYF